MYKGKRYIFMCVFLVLILAVTLGCSAISTGTQTNQNTDEQEQGGGVDIPDDIIQIDPGKDDGTTGSTTVPKFTTGMQAVEYAINLMENGAGYSSYFAQDTITPVGTQKIVVKKYRTGNENITEEWCYFDGSLGVNRYESYYSDGKNIMIKTLNDKSKFSYKDLSYQSCKPDKLQQYTCEEWVNARNRNPLNNMFTVVNKNTIKGTPLFDKSNKNYYRVVVQLDPDKLSYSYLKTYYDNGVTNITFDRLQLTFYISKTNGYLLKYEKDESLTGTYSILSGVECSCVCTEVYTAMNTDLSDTISQIYQKNFVY